MPWQLSLGLFYIAVVCQALLQRAYSQRSKLPTTVPPAIAYIASCAPLGIIVGLFMQHHIRWGWQLMALLVIEGMFFGIFNWISFNAVKRLPLARYQTIYQSYELVVIVLGWVLLQERLRVTEVCGGALLFGGALLAIRAPSRLQTKSAQASAHSGILLTLAAALTIGIAQIAEKASLKYMDIGAYFIFGYFTQALAAGIVASKDLTTISLRRISWYEYSRSLGMGILSALMGFFYIFAIYKSDNVSLVAALSAFVLPLIVLASYIFLNEKYDQKLLWLAVSLGVAGLAISAL